MAELSNFEFLKEHDPVFIQLAFAAEQSFSADPNTTLIKLRQLGEAFAQDMAARCGIEFDEKTSQADLLIKLYREIRLDPNILLRPYLNKVVVADSDGVCITEIIPLSGGENLNNRYLFFWLKHPAFLAYVNKVGYGVNMPRLGTKDGNAAPFVLAPIAEQQQIAAKLDELLAQVDTLKIRLDTIPKILKRFRQPVLVSAVSGRLTENWRKIEMLNNWLETKIGQVAIVSTGKSPIRSEAAYWENGIVPWLTIAATGKEFCYKAEQFLTEFAVNNAL